MWQSQSSRESSGQKGLQFIYSLFDPIRPMSTFVSTAPGSVCVYCREIEREKKERGGGLVVQEASKATVEQASEHCIRPMFIS